MQAQHKNLKMVVHATFIHKMHIAKAKLVNEKIKSFIIDEHLTYTIGTAFMEEYKLKVNVSDYDKTLTILSLYKT